MAKMLSFTKVNQETPLKRSTQLRREDFNEIYERFAMDKAEAQASRCSQCGVPFCQVHCPLNNNIPDWLKMTAEGRMREAYEVAASTNTMPEICGRICPQDRLCEGNCVIEQSGHGSVTIGAVEKHITDTAFAEGWVEPVVPYAERSESVGIIGAGPAAYGAAEMLRRDGFQVTIYDRYDRAGGLLIYGIPGFKLEKEIVERRTKWLEDSGVGFRLNCNVGTDISFADIRKNHDAVLIATGVYKARGLELPNAHAEGVIPAMEFLTASNRIGLGDHVQAFEDGTLNAKGKKVVVIGGGDTAMDCVRTAIRQEATEVTCLYRRDRENMPGSQREVANAEDEGVRFEWLASPKAFTTQNDRVAGVLANRMKLGQPDATGRRKPEIVDGADFAVDADIVIKALGFDPEDLPGMFGEPELPVSRWGTIRVDYETGMTPMEGVFAAGDIVRGASLVVWAVRDGRDAAAAIAYHINAKSGKIAVAS